MYSSLPRQANNGVSGGVHRGPCGGAARGRSSGEQKLHLQVPPRGGRAGHLRGELHVLPPHAGHLRHHRRGRHVQLLGQGEQAAAEGDEQVQGAHPVRRLQPRRHHPLVRLELRLAQGRRRAQPRGGHQQDLPPRRAGQRGEAAQEDPLSGRAHRAVRRAVRRVSRTPSRRRGFGGAAEAGQARAAPLWGAARRPGEPRAEPSAKEGGARAARGELTTFRRSRGNDRKA
mmetsp:Transcript_2284/g.4599  ORF Transcript_2284/g.4599 Transcript_2284/m.4599 type:complete len:229 (+) Transcript_2284:769-1455(+)